MKRLKQSLHDEFLHISQEIISFLVISDTQIEHSPIIGRISLGADTVSDVVIIERSSDCSSDLSSDEIIGRSIFFS